jgi:hypothetical protein
MNLFQMFAKMMPQAPAGPFMMMPPGMAGAMMGPPGGSQPVYVLLPNHQMMMAPFFAPNGDYMAAPQGYMEQQQPMYDFGQTTQPVMFNPQLNTAPIAQQPQAVYFPNYQAYWFIDLFTEFSYFLT